MEMGGTTTLRVHLHPAHVSTVNSISRLELYSLSKKHSIECKTPLFDSWLENRVFILHVNHNIIDTHFST